MPLPQKQSTMPTQARFKKAHPFQNDVLALPVTDLASPARCRQ
jgi:hypothetical protein